MTRTPARTKAKELAKFLRTERPDYAYLKSVFRELRKELEIEVEGREPFVLGPLFIPPIQVLGATVSLIFLTAFGWFFLKSRKGIAMRAVADNQQVAMAMGIDVERYFGLAWAMTGIVSALGGILWGNLLGVDINLALVGFKVFPVVILGGLDSIPGAVVGGLIVGIVENVAAGYIDPHVGGGTKDFAPYVLMIVALMVRPYGIFGKRIIERV